MNILSESPTPRERLLDAMLVASCAIEEGMAVFAADAEGIELLQPHLHALRLSTDALIQRLAE